MPTMSMVDSWCVNMCDIETTGNSKEKKSLSFLKEKNNGTNISLYQKEHFIFSIGFNVITGKHISMELAMFWFQFDKVNCVVT